MGATEYRPLAGFVVALAAACATPPSPPPSIVVVPAAPPKPAPMPVVLLENPVEQGELPWWHDLEPGVYQTADERVVYAVGRSSDHHHVTEGFLTAKVTARLGVRKAAEPVAFSGTMPEPELSDLFITRQQRFYALYRMPLPAEARLAAPPRRLPVPQALKHAGRRRLGRHVFDGARHMYLECEVEGPIANPDWGRTRATAWLLPPRRSTVERTP